MSSHEKMLREAEAHLQAACPHMRRLVRSHGPCQLQLQEDRFQMLVRSITSQQLSAHASRAIVGRLYAWVAPASLSPESVRACGEDGLRGMGYSQRKASYVQGLAAEVLDRGLDFDALKALGDEEVVQRLTKLRGIGEWTAHMYLIFSLGRPDVLPFGDLGVRQALKRFHGLDELPNKRKSIELARPWRPFASVASWYCWRSVDAKTGRETA